MRNQYVYDGLDLSLPTLQKLKGQTMNANPIIVSQLMQISILTIFMMFNMACNEPESATDTTNNTAESCTENHACNFGILVDFDCTAGYGGRCQESIACGKTKYCYEEEDYPASDCPEGVYEQNDQCMPIQEPFEETPTAEQLWAQLRSEIEAEDINELVVMFGDQNGIRFVHEKGAGADQRFPIASASKLLSSILVMKLVETGVMSLDDHPQQYIDWWTNDSNDPRSQVTLAQLLSFTSGFSGGTGLGNQSGVECVEDRESNLDECSRAIYEEHFQFEPGTTFYYGPSHLHIAANMAEKATNETWNRLFRRLIYDALNLSDMTAYIIPSLRHPRASGGAIASANDYAKILTALVSGSFLSEQALNELSQDRTPLGTEFASVPDTADNYGDWHYALGCWRECSEAEYSESCDELGVISSPGAFGFYPWFDQSSGYWGLIATQTLMGPSLTVPLGQRWYIQAKQALETTP